MKKAFKTIFIYIGVLMLAALATFIFCAGFLFFYRDGNIFGIQYIKADEIIIATDNEDMSGIKAVEVIGDKFDVRVRINPNVDTLKGAMQNRVYGYAKKSKAQASFSMEYDEVAKTAVFKSVEPKGWLNKKNCFIEIAIPKDFADKNIDIVVKTGKGDINIGNDKDLAVGELILQSSKGDVIISNVEINDKIDLNIGSGTAVVDDKCLSSGVDSVISVGSGKVDYSKINVEAFDFDVVEVKSIKRGKIWIKKADELLTTDNIGGGGKIEIQTISTVDFTSLDTDINIKEIVGSGTSRINITGHGKINIYSVVGGLDIDGHNGDVYLCLSANTGSLSVSSNQGDITIENAHKSVSVDSVYGNIKITFSSNAGGYTNVNPENRAVSAITKNGHIIVDGLQNGNITATGNGRISLKYNRVVGENKVVANSGVVNIVVPCPTEGSYPNQYGFNLKIVDTEVNADIKIGVVGHLGDLSESITSNTSGEQIFNKIYSTILTGNNLEVQSTTGTIKIRDAGSVEF